MVIESIEPSRIDLAGGTLNTYPLYLFEEGGITVNAAITVRSKVRLTTNGDGHFRLVSLDSGLAQEARSVDELALGGPMDLIVRLVEFCRPSVGVTIEIHNDARRVFGWRLTCSRAEQLPNCQRDGKQEAVVRERRERLCDAQRLQEHATEVLNDAQHDRHCSSRNQQPVDRGHEDHLRFGDRSHTLILALGGRTPAVDRAGRTRPGRPKPQCGRVRTPVAYCSRPRWERSTWGGRRAQGYTLIEPVRAIQAAVHVPCEPSLPVHVPEPTYLLLPGAIGSILPVAWNVMPQPVPWNVTLPSRVTVPVIWTGPLQMGETRRLPTSWPCGPM